jgi:hypothetical protein
MQQRKLDESITAAQRETLRDMKTIIDTDVRKKTAHLSEEQRSIWHQCIDAVIEAVDTQIVQHSKVYNDA